MNDGASRRFLVSAHTVRRNLPELGTLTRQQSAAWVGVAPLHGDRGTLRGKCAIWGGRAPGRPVLSLSPLVTTRVNPQMQTLSQRLLAAGTVKKVALTACRCQFLTVLHAMLKQRTPWQPQEVQSSNIDQALLATKTVATRVDRSPQGAEARLSR